MRYGAALLEGCHEGARFARRARTSSTPSRPRAATRSRRCSSPGCAQPSQRAYDNVAHYRRTLRRSRREPRRSQHPSTTSPSFPFTVKEDLRLNYPFELFAVPREQHHPHPCLERHHRASPPSWATPRNDLDTWAALVARCLRAAGARPGDMVHVAYGYGALHRRSRLPRVAPRSWAARWSPHRAGSPSVRSG